MDTVTISKKQTRNNQHHWAFVPELGPDWWYCDLCDKGKHLPTGKLYTYKQALKLTYVGKN